MRSNVQHRPTTAEEMGLGPKKTALILFTVVGCIAILFPKIFYPMIVGVPKENMRGPPSKCLDTILNLIIPITLFDSKMLLKISRSKNDLHIHENKFILVCKREGELLITRIHRFRFLNDLVGKVLQEISNDV